MPQPVQISDLINDFTRAMFDIQEKTGFTLNLDLYNNNSNIIYS